eukprot:31166-Pelagococcus_subviridis.AAC.5
MILLRSHARAVIALRVRVHVHAREVVLQRAVSEVFRDVAEIQHVLQRRRRAHALALQRLLVDPGRDDERRHAREARGRSRGHRLNVPAHGVLAHAALHPRLTHLQTRLVYAHPRLVVVHAREHEVDPARARVRVLQRLRESMEPLHGGDVHVVRLVIHVRVDVAKRSHRGVRLRHPRVLWAEEEAVHVRELDGVEVVELQAADPAAREHLRGDGADAADADDGDGFLANFFVLAHDPHALQRHEARVRVRVDHLRGHVVRGDLRARRRAAAGDGGVSMRQREALVRDRDGSLRLRANVRDGRDELARAVDVRPERLDLRAQGLDLGSQIARDGRARGRGGRGGFRHGVERGRATF